jgi:putative flippase GtrA
MDGQFNLKQLYRKIEENFSELNIQIMKFTIIGVLAVLVDLGTYFTLLNILPEKLFILFSNEAVSKTMSFLCGLTVTYTFNKYWTWKEKGRSARRFMRFITLYGISLVINVSVNSSLLFILHRFSWLKFVPYKYFVAFTGATVLSAVMNFIGQKFWVFKPKLEYQECQP